MTTRTKELDPNGKLIKTIKTIKTKEEESYLLGFQAFVWGYPVAEMYRQAEGRTSGPEPIGTNAPMNEFGHANQIVTADWSSGLNPNADTLYSTAWLDLREEPLVLQVPPMDKVDDKERYYVLPFLRAFNEVFFSIGTSNEGARQGEYLIHGPDWNGKTPRTNMTLVASPTRLAWIVGRTFVDGQDDLDAVRKIQDGYRLTPLSRYPEGLDQPPVGFPGGADYGKVPEMPKGIDYFATLSKLMKKEEMPAGESLHWKAFERIDLNTDSTVDFSPNRATTDGLERAAIKAESVLNAQLQGEVVNGWMYNLEYGRYTEYFARSLASWVQGSGANVPEEAIYLCSVWDQDKRALDSKESYEIRFEAGKLPPVEAFWSISSYRTDGNPVANEEVDRFYISDRTDGIEFGEDGSLTIYIQSTPPEHGTSNWLPCPNPEEEGGESFVMFLRAYLPDEEILNFEYVFPEIRRVD